MRFVLFLFAILSAVPLAAQRFTQQQADSLKLALTGNISGAMRMKTLIHVAEYHILKAGELKADLDSAGDCLAEAERLNKTVQSSPLMGYLLLMKGFMLREGGNRGEARKVVQQSAPLLEKSGDQQLLGRLYYELGSYYDYGDSLQSRERIRLTGMAAKAYRLAGDKEQEAGALTMLADLHTLQREYLQSNEYLFQALAAYNAVGYKQLQGVYIVLGRNYSIQGDYRHAYEYTLLALDAAKATNDTSQQMAAIYYLLGGLHRNAGRREMCIDYYEQALAISVHHKSVGNVRLVASSLGRAYMESNQYRKALDMLRGLPPGLLDTTSVRGKALLGMVYMGGYYWEKQLDKAYEQAAVLEKLVEKNDSFNEWFDNVCIALAKFYLKERALAKARFFLNKSLNLTAPPKAATWSARYETQYKVDSAEQNYRNAFFDLLTYKVFEDSVRNEIKSRQFQQLDVEYQTSKKEDSIFMLTQKNTLQTANLHQVQKIRDITIVGIVLALIIIGLLYRQYQVKQRNNKMMALKNEDLGRLVTEKEWLLQEVNHRVKNNLQTIVSLLELQPDTLSEDASLALQASQNRVFATSLLYQKLYKTENPSAVNMKVYLTELVDHLKDALGSSGKVNLILDIEPVEIDVSQGVSIGLIVNEVVTNSFKYAFDGTIEHPAIYISLAIHQGHAHLIIKDNGIGFSIAGEHGSGQGLKLVKGLSESISGRATFVSDNGASTQVSFLPKKPLGPMVHHYAS